ncbi:MAG TPA: tetratricopeptide repeat protein [Streptosporangiaceae bacterium]
MLGDAASGPNCATGVEQRSAANLQGLLDARQRLLDAGDTGAASRLAEGICARLRDQGDLAGAAALGQATLDAMPAPSAGAARWLHELGTIAQLCGDDAQAYDRHLLAATMFCEVGDTAGVARSYDSLGTLAHARGDYQQAEHYYRAATSFHAPPPPGIAGRPAPAGPLAVARAPLPGSRHSELALADIAAAEPRSTSEPGSEAACAEAARARATRTRAALARVGAARGPGSRPPRPPRPPRRARRIRPAALAAGTVVVAAAACIAVIASDGWAGSAPVRADPAQAGLAAGASAGTATDGGTGASSATAGAAGAGGAARAGGARVQAAAWVARQAGSRAVVSCDPAMCTALRAQGVPAGNLLVIGAAGQSDPLGSDIVAATAAVRGTLGARLARVYAPLVLAQFGTGSARIEIRLTAPDGSAAYLRALRADRAARVNAGQQLLANRRLSEDPGPERELADGQVDSRLLTTIAALTAVRRLRIVAFTASGPGADPRVPLPSAELAATGTGAALSDVAAFLRAQRPPYLAAVISAARLPSGQPVLRVTFGEPGPVGLLGPAR